MVYRHLTNTVVVSLSLGNVSILTSHRWEVIAVASRWFRYMYHPSMILATFIHVNY